MSEESESDAEADSESPAPAEVSSSSLEGPSAGGRFDATGRDVDAFAGADELLPSSTSSAGTSLSNAR